MAVLLGLSYTDKCREGRREDSIKPSSMEIKKNLVVVWQL